MYYSSAQVSGGKMEVRTAHGESTFLEPDELVRVLDMDLWQQLINS